MIQDILVAMISFLALLGLGVVIVLLYRAWSIRAAKFAVQRLASSSAAAPAAAGTAEAPAVGVQYAAPTVDDLK